VLGGRKNCPDSISEKPIFSFSLRDAENFVTRPKQGFRSGDMRMLHKKSADQIILISNSVFQNRVRHQQKAGVLYASACQHKKSCLNPKRRPVKPAGNDALHFPPVAINLQTENIRV